MATSTESIPTPPITPLSFSLLISSPIRRNIPFAPVTAAILPLAKVKLPYANLVVAALDIFTAFLTKRFPHEATSPQRLPPENYPVTLTLAQLAELIQNYSQGQGTRLNPTPCRPDLRVASNEDEPLFPDHLSVSLFVSGPLDGFDGTPDSSFNVPLFSIPGVPGNLIIAVITLIAQFLLEQANVNGSTGTPASQCLRR
ncbi:hypothetical protein Desdi_3133 [Desulfitobacterium dichloroeliminans LMG P-21439]|uniref:Uncharacterized protein n=1 Tax=Desulfitobacterium dichloroeliminans (strain LMG P-21439 / DCA1) TaxID=871963 RepID=L0F9R0_DESDL|nr:hypothetical protein Desdi_3133 [Desulfitobacterium dichloroeliminans LMG P-21439]